jgi:hypothetical protein
MTDAQWEALGNGFGPVERENIEAWIRGIDAGIWNPTPAMKQKVRAVLKDYLLLVPPGAHRDGADDAAE